jgi:hypothetical protein
MEAFRCLLDMDERKGLSRELQISLGEKLRDIYSTFIQSLPLHLVVLARKVRGGGSAKSASFVALSETFGHISAESFDPETIAIVDEAFDKAWKDLDYLTTNPATRTALAIRLIALLKKGERNPSRLATKAVLELVAPLVPNNNEA